MCTIFMCTCVWLSDTIYVSGCLQQDQQQPQEGGQGLPSASHVRRQRLGAGELIFYML